MVRGEVRLVLRDVNTGEITQEIEGHNYVTEDQLNRMAGCEYDINDYGGGTYGRFGQYIWIGGLDQEHDRGWNQMWNIFERGSIETGITSPDWLNDTVGTGGTPARYYQYQNRFSPPSSDRIIYTIGINRDDYENHQNDSSNNPLYVAAYIVLTSPCIQTTTETLDVVYRIIWDNPEQDTSDYVPSGNAMYAISQRHLYGSTQYAYYPYNSMFMYHGRKMIPNIRGQWLNTGQRGRGRADGNSGSLNSGLDGAAYADTAYRARIMYTQSELYHSLGMIVGSVFHTGTRNIDDESELSALPNPAVPPNVSPIQNIFSHSDAATGPFYSAGSVPAGNGTLSINGDAWTNPDYQKLLRIQITGSGGVGAGTYQVWMRNTTGFVNNTYNDNIVAIPFINQSNNWHDIMFDNSASDTGSGRIWIDRSFTERVGAMTMSYDGVSTLVGWTHYMVFKYNVLTGERVAFRNDTTPGFAWTDISQVCVADNGDIWVADAQNGLFRIHADDSAIDQFDNTHANLSGIANSECFGVTKTPGRIWAIMNNSLVYTTDNGASFTVYDGSSTPTFSIAPAGEERRYWFLQGDPTHADHRLAIGYNEYSSFGSIGDTCYLRITWWDSVSGQGANTPRLTQTSAYSDYRYTDPQRRRELFQFFHCSPNDGVWASRRTQDASTSDDDNPGIWTYGGTQPTHDITAGSSDSNEEAWIFWWSKDINGDDAMLLTTRDGSDHRFILFRQDGTAHYNLYMNRDTSPRALTGYPSNGFEHGQKAFFPDTAMFVMSGRDANIGHRSWYLTSVSDNANSDAGPMINCTWKRYGWDGANWVEGNTNSKTIHATDEALIDGLTVSFDDNAGAQTFVDTDYYTVGVIDGILLDGGTEFDTRYALYYKPVDFDRTEIEGGGVLPATQSDAQRGLDETEQSTMIDNFNTTYDAGNNRFQGTSSGAWGTRLYGAMPKRAYFQSRVIDISNGPTAYRQVFGLASASKIGTSPSETNIDYAIRVTAADDNYNWRVEVLNNGTVVHTEYNPSAGLSNYQGEFNSQNDQYVYYRFDRRDETVGDLEIRCRNKIIYTFTGVSQSLIPTIWSSQWSQSGYHYWNSMTTTYTDYHVDLGSSGLSVGKFDPNFFAIDWTLPGRPRNDEIKIDGTPVSTILVNDYGRTALSSGEIEILTHQGKIRYSAADVGKTLTIDRYNVILHE